MKPITQIPYKGIDIQFLHEGKYVGYSFGYEGRNYGQKVLSGRTKQSIMDAVALLTINAIESLEQLQHDKNTNKPATSRATSNRRKGNTRSKH